MTGPIVVVGGGLAAGTLVTKLRERGHEGPIVLLTDEAHPPYERPPLSKDLLLGKAEPTDAHVHEQAWYDEHDVDLRTSTAVTAIDREGRRVQAGGEWLGYDTLVLATGARPRHLALADDSGVPVTYLRTIDDSLALRERLTKGTRVGIIGGGWIGLEVASAARQHDAEVVVLESLDLPLLRVLGPEVAQVFADLHREHGVRFHFGARLTEITGQDGMVLAVQTDDGEEHPAHDVLAAIGAAPRTALAEAAGLELADRAAGGGIAVDSSLRTSDPDIYAAGDVANAQHPLLGGRLRVEHWANALNGGPVAARAMLGQDVVYDRVPYFFTDQYDLGMEFSGHAAPGTYDQVLARGDVGKRQFIAFWLSDGRVLAGMNVNVWDVTDPIQQLIRSGRQIDPDRLSDPSVPLSELLD
jgi:3-phenylpropionate/trans-cinnamate dioxygenase ferredoxin reductase subunit